MNLPLTIPNVIPKGYQDALEADLTARTFSWLYVDDVTYNGFGCNGGLVHPAFDFGNPPSDYMQFIKPIIYSIEEASGIPIKQLLRIRIGFLTQRFDEGYEHNAPHVDFHQSHYTACYYVNDSDGDTLVFDKKLDDVGVDITEDKLYNYTRDTKFNVVARCAPRKGTVFIMDGKSFHASTNPKDSKRRLVVTINWI